MTKTPILSGTEVCVEDLGGQNAAVKNLSDSTCWASIYPNITAGADNVVEIPAGAGEVVLDAHGTVYLLGNGKVQCTGTDYSTPNFKMPSSSASGGGGDTPIGETMPHLDGLKGYFDWQDADTENAVWKNKLGEACTLELVGDCSVQDDCLRFSASGLGKCNIENPAHVIYAIMKVADPYIFNTNYPQFISEISNFAYNNRLCLCLAPRNGVMSTGADNGMRLIAGAWGSPNYSVNTYATNYYVYCLARDEDFNFSVYTNLDFDYSFVIGNTTKVSAAGYLGTTLLNSESKNGTTFNPENASIASDWKFFAIGDGVQTPEQIRENIAWLAKKYGIGGG